MQEILHNDNRLRIHLVEPCPRLRATIAQAVFSLGHHCEVYSELAEFLAHQPDDGLIMARDIADEGGIVVLMGTLLTKGVWLPVIAADAAIVPERIVAAMKAGAIDYVALPLEIDVFAQCLERWPKEMEGIATKRRKAIEARERLSGLSQREREVLDYLTAGATNKYIAHQLNISPRTVEFHRASMMEKVGARHASEAVRIRLTCGEPLPAAV